MKATVEFDMHIPTAPGFTADIKGVVRAGGPKGLAVGEVVAVEPKEPGSSVLVFTLDLPECEVYLGGDR